MDAAIASMDHTNYVSHEVIGCAIRIHRALGPGLYESVYEAILARDLHAKGFQVERQKAFPLEFEGLRFTEAFRTDLIVDNCTIVEIKSMRSLSLADEKQILTYMALLGIKLGLILNFGAAFMREGIERYIR